MMTLKEFSTGQDTIPTVTSWYLADLGGALGKQKLFTDQSPHRLKALREHALILKTACHEFEERVGETKSPRGAKTELIKAAIIGFPGEFTLSDLERACPGVSRDMARRVLRDLKKSGKVECLGRGPGAAWKKRG